ncbi:ATP synthase F1 subunit delta [Williamwhitmania taraxaci]|uniref:ATP synthase subunit delta n=1 Tax=Williamwhitmania taraxaci TaxID=1640674 RepID=A0A1G6GYU3_9BACT|nr:ATP synthase F1 subunit delta [Williamwhitmania taraxaci]SDB87074.1 ATP synthase F1 subcomplex delta subunit [Williamwhitmania taraxaci]
MNHGRLHVKYANALYDFAESSNAIQVVYEDMNKINNLLATSPELLELLDSPVIYPTRKKELIDKLFLGRLSDVTIRYLHFLVDKHREMHLKYIAITFFRIYREKMGITRVEFVSALEVSDTFKVTIRKELEKSISGELELVFQTKADLIGGFTLALNDSLLDASVATKLRRLKTKVQESYNSH